MHIIKIEQTDSTNNWLVRHEEEIKEPTLVYCHEQIAGRGQRGNSWESEPGKNITASLIFRPQCFAAHRQFEISEAVALAIVEFLKDYGVESKIKWPNDIYVGDRKICGILVEQSVIGSQILRSIAGMGININQEEFRSDAPNPISIIMLTGKSFEIDEAIGKLASCLEKNINKLEGEHNFHRDFLSCLWRKDGECHNFYDRKNEEKIEAEIIDVAKDGMLRLRTDKGEIRTYVFKEVEFIV